MIATIATSPTHPNWSPNPFTTLPLAQQLKVLHRYLKILHLDVYRAWCATGHERNYTYVILRYEALITGDSLWSIWRNPSYTRLVEQ